jgi:hypothetical protein
MSANESHNGYELSFAALKALLELFRKGHITARHSERKGITEYAGPLTALWDKRFPGFPKKYFPYTSLRGQYYRTRRDAYLRDIIVRILADHNSADTTIVNVACVFGRDACDLASRLPDVTVIGTDINEDWNRLYRLAKRSEIPDNYSFQKDDIFETELDVQPTAVVFFGACGSVTDGAMDYAVNSGARYLMCRTCCHDNIGGNVSIAGRFSNMNSFFRLKNRFYAWVRGKERYTGYHFSDKYSRDAYPRSAAAKTTSSSDEFQAVARHSVDSDICRTIIDLDRYLYLTENGFSALYQGELFVAERNAQSEMKRW